MRLALILYVCLVFAAVLLSTGAPPVPAQISRISNENAYNPIPSPDGEKIVAVRTGWGRWGGSGGTGRSNLRSDLIVLDRFGHLLSPTALAESFAADWNRDNSGVAFFSAEGLVISSPDGKNQRVVFRPEEPAGLAVPSPDGDAIAYATFRSRSCTGIWWVSLKDSSGPKRLTQPSQDSTYDLRWIDNRHLVFDQVRNGIPPKASLWMVTVKR